MNLSGASSQIAAQTLAAAPAQRQTGALEFEALTLKVALPTKIIAASPAEIRDLAKTAVPEMQNTIGAGPVAQSNPGLNKALRPGTILDIRV